jgi:hypothetical protein
MGSPPGEPERRSGEDQVEVTLTRGFWIGKYEVTQNQWQCVVGEFPGEQAAGEGPKFPVFEGDGQSDGQPGPGCAGVAVGPTRAGPAGRRVAWGSSPSVGVTTSASESSPSGAECEGEVLMNDRGLPGLPACGPSFSLATSSSFVNLPMIATARARD